MRVLGKILGVILLCTVMHAYAQNSELDQIYYDDPKAPLQGYKYRWAVGFDISDQIMHPVNDFAYITYNYRHGLALYAAYRTRGPLGFELGYHWTTDKAKNISTVPGTVLFNTTAKITAEYQCKLRVEDYYTDAYWHYKYRKIVEFKFGVGAGFERQNMVFYNPNGVSDPVEAALFNMYTNTTICARFNLGVQAMLTRRIGCRAIFGYMTTHTILACNVPAGANPHMFANSYMFSLGLFYTITGHYEEELITH